MDFYAPMQAEKVYHIYNRSNNKDLLFPKIENHTYFLKKWAEYLADFMDVYTYCLLPNHFHLMARMKDENQIQEAFAKVITEKGTTSKKFEQYNRNRTNSSQRTVSSEPLNTDEIISEQFRNLFSGYSKAINKQENRTGSLFQKQFKRLPVENDLYFTRLIWYIHRNPMHHRISKDFREYAWSSYQRLLLPQASKLDKAYIFDWFGGKAAFIKFHTEQQNLEDMQDLLIEGE
ncbi:MAG: hypothetical protein EAZ55_05735 [Cytophagales bacterium]|nr:MAG: hypothetical protein EAZ55_05735 [Cytophagales bacterium]